MSEPSELLVATNNAGKVRELAQLLSDLPLRLRLLSEFDIPEAEETGATFAENAARASSASSPSPTLRPARSTPSRASARGASLTRRAAHAASATTLCSSP